MPDDTRTPFATRPRVARKWRLVVTCVVAFVATVIALGFFAAPPLLKPLIEKRLSAALGRNIEIGRLRINPLALSTTLNDVVIGERAGDGRVLALDELYINTEGVSLLRWAPKGDGPPLVVMRSTCAMKSNSISKLRSPSGIGPVVRPRAET